jgi:hypothetical protein
MLRDDRILIIYKDGTRKSIIVPVGVIYMEVRACKNCRRLFNYIYGPELCPDCITMVKWDSGAQQGESNKPGLKPLVLEEEKKLEQVKDYIMANPNATITKISEVNDVSASKLFEWIREERLEFSDNSEYAWFECAKCGTKIKSGVYCNRCKPRS